MHFDCIIIMKGRLKMKFFKKFAMAVTAVAICCTATLPTVANAACSHNYVSAGTHSITLGAYSEHTYNGQTCRIDKVEYYKVMRCTNCGDEYSYCYDTDLIHRLCGQ